MIKSNLNKEKNEKGSNRMEPCNSLILSYDSSREKKYLNVSVVEFHSCASMAEWLLQLTDPKRPSGYGGSIPSAGVMNFNFRGGLIK